GEIELRGDRGSFALVGDTTASSTAIAIGEADRDDDEIDQDTTIGLTIESGRGVEFLWPNENVPILRGFAAAGETVTIAVQSETGSFGVDGTVGIQGGEIFYFDRSFYITEGEIIFAEDQTEFDPRLSVQAEIREISEEGPVRIYLVADENPLSEFSPRWRSDPPLSETDILALLGGTVFIGESGEPIDFSQAVLLTSDFVSQFGLIRNFERSVRDALQLDLFSIRTQLFQNLLRGVIDQNAAVPLDTTVPSLGQYLDNTTLFAGRYLGTDLFLEMFVQVSETEAEPGSPQSLTGIEVDSEVSLEWETPFFQLEWAFFPRDPSTLFLTDNTIRFSWDFSY
ncbi:MAG: translocation/assembly module TamB domain-containing protein, partial [Spirochaetales bacterium]